MIDSEININGWSPKNYKKEYVGEISLNDAFAKSIKPTIAVKLSEQVGRENVIKVAKALGISSPPKQDSPSIALGASEVNLLELTSAYNVLANNGDGIFISWYKVNKENTSGEFCYEKR